MSLIIATGSNLGNRTQNLTKALEHLKTSFEFIAQSNVYESEPIDYLDQPSFLNQVLEFKIPADTKAEAVMNLLLHIEKTMGRVRDTSKGPRIIDLDIIFWSNHKINSTHLCIPHPHWRERSFVVLPLRELPYFKELQEQFIFPEAFHTKSFLYNELSVN